MSPEFETCPTFVTRNQPSFCEVCINENLLCRQVAGKGLRPRAHRWRNLSAATPEPDGEVGEFSGRVGQVWRFGFNVSFREVLLKAWWKESGSTGNLLQLWSKWTLARSWLSQSSAIRARERSATSRHKSTIQSKKLIPLVDKKTYLATLYDLFWKSEVKCL